VRCQSGAPQTSFGRLAPARVDRRRQYTVGGLGSVVYSSLKKPCNPSSPCCSGDEVFQALTTDAGAVGVGVYESCPFSRPERTNEWAALACPGWRSHTLVDMDACVRM